MVHRTDYQNWIETEQHRQHQLQAAQQRRLAREARGHRPRRILKFHTALVQIWHTLFG